MLAKREQNIKNIKHFSNANQAQYGLGKTKNVSIGEFKIASYFNLIILHSQHMPSLGKYYLFQLLNKVYLR